jgi:hypothetical protein
MTAAIFYGPGDYVSAARYTDPHNWPHAPYTPRRRQVAEPEPEPVAQEGRGEQWTQAGLWEEGEGVNA